MKPESTIHSEVVAVPQMARSASRSQTFILCCAIFVLGYFLSLVFLDLYWAGDQRYYEQFWYSMLGAPSYLWAQLQFQHLGSKEPLYGLIIAIGGYTGLDRLVYLSIWNGLLLATVGWAILKYRASLFFALLVFTNFYIMVLLSSAERLKFAYLLLVLSFCISNVRWKVIFSLLSPFAHTQAVIQFVSSAAYYVASNYKKIFARKRNIFGFLVGGSLAIGIAAYYLISSVGEVAAKKSEFYGGESEGVLELVQWVLILLSGAIVFNKRMQFLIGMLPMGVLTVLYGSRINVATLFFFCALALTQRKTAHPVVLAVMAYMSFKSIGFIENVLNTGQGF